MVRSRPSSPSPRSHLSQVEEPLKWLRAPSAGGLGVQQVAIHLPRRIWFTVYPEKNGGDSCLLVKWLISLPGKLSQPRAFNCPVAAHDASCTWPRLRWGRIIVSVSAVTFPPCWLGARVCASPSSVSACDCDLALPGLTSSFLCGRGYSYHWRL